MSRIKVITVSREFGAGGGEVARRTAELLRWKLLDRELLHQAAAIEHLPDTEIERWDERAVGVAGRFQLHPAHKKYIHGLTQAVCQAAGEGQVVIVGRGARQILADTPSCFHLRLVAPRWWRAERIARLECCSPERALARCVEIDRQRSNFTRYFFGNAAFHPEQYDLVVNTGRVPLEEVVAWMVAVIREDWSLPLDGPAGTCRVLTLSRQLGAGDTGFAPTLARRLRLRVYDRDVLEQESVRLGVPQAELEKIDEQPTGFFERFRPGSVHHQYGEALRQIMRELAERGDVMLVGRGGSRFLSEHPNAFHVKLVASLSERLRRVMDHRWLRQAAAEKLIHESDTQRGRFYREYFGADWSDPLEYHITVNTGRLGPTAVDLLAFAAERYWRQRPASTPHINSDRPNGK